MFFWIYADCTYYSVFYVFEFIQSNLFPNARKIWRKDPAFCEYGYLKISLREPLSFLSHLNHTSCQQQQ